MASMRSLFVLALLSCYVSSVYAGTKYTTPQHATDKIARAQAIMVKREGYTYGESLMGNTAPFPNGTLGNAMVQRDLAQWKVDAEAIVTSASIDLEAAQKSIVAAGGFQSFESYNLLYVNEWTASIPGGEAPGLLTNATQDLFFSMQRLSSSPFSIRRLDPKVDGLPFTVDNETALAVAGLTLTALFGQGRLFYVDYRTQSKYNTTTRYTAYCDAYFYISPMSGDFLPLAIRTNVGSNLVYTPNDSPNDWLLAKIMFEVNDLLFAEVYHLVNQHDVAEAVHQAAIRTLSDEHPILAILNRLMYQAYAIRPEGQSTLLNPGTAFDQFFAVSGAGTSDYATNLYATSAGAFTPNYFHADLETRGLVNSSIGPPLKSFPYHEDVSVIHSAQHDFFTNLLNMYYESDLAVLVDGEFQAFLQEAVYGAKVQSFPTAPLASRKTVIEILTHFALTTGTTHHLLNTDSLSSIHGTLPLHPTSLYAPPPTTKGVASILPFLPGPDKALGQVDLMALFSRAIFKDTGNVTTNMFNDEALLGGMPKPVRVAQEVFRKKMEKFRDKIRARSFDQDGLCQGMPFVWRSVDPGSTPFFLAV